jgi:molecular chaperone GrpE
MDNMERALQAVADPEEESVKALCEGIKLTIKEFLTVLNKFAIEQIDPEGEPFDPQMHQAISMVENPDVEPNTVIAVVQKGYSLNGRVIRPAMVMVSK